MVLMSFVNSPIARFLYFGNKMPRPPGRPRLCFGRGVGANGVARTLFLRSWKRPDGTGEQPQRRGCYEEMHNPRRYVVQTIYEVWRGLRHRGACDSASRCQGLHKVSILPYGLPVDVPRWFTARLYGLCSTRCREDECWEC